MKRNVLAAVAAFLMAAGVSSLYAQTQWPAACGSDNVKFKVKTEKKQGALTAPDADKGQLVLVENLKGDFGARPLIRFGVDGSWVGADDGPSYFAVLLTPGVHHLCASWQSSIKSEKDNIGIATVNVVAGKVSFYEFTVTRSEVGSVGRQDGGGGLDNGMGHTPDMTARNLPTVDTVDFHELSADEGPAHIKKMAASTSSPR